MTSFPLRGSAICHLDEMCNWICYTWLLLVTHRLFLDLLL